MGSRTLGGVSAEQEWLEGIAGWNTLVTLYDGYCHDCGRPVGKCDLGGLD
jgi:hypothetical protein